MKFLAFYNDPKKKRLQRAEVALLVVALPIALVWGARSFQEWSSFRQAETLMIEADVALHEARADDALAAFEKAVEAYPEFYAAWDGLGTTYHMKNEHDKELEVYQRAVAILPGRGEIHRELATAFHEVGDHASELRHLEIACGLFTEDDIFTTRLMDRAQREMAGTYPMVSVGSTVPETVPTPSLDVDEHGGHSHD